MSLCVSPHDIIAYPDGACSACISEGVWVWWRTDGGQKWLKPSASRLCHLFNPSFPLPQFVWLQATLCRPTHYAITDANIAAFVLPLKNIRVPRQREWKTGWQPSVFCWHEFICIYLNKGRPTWWHLLYYVNLLLNMFQMLIHPSSGACDCLVRGSAGTRIPHHQQPIPLHNTNTSQVSTIQPTQ